MSQDSIGTDTSRAIDELATLIRTRFPDAAFETGPGGDEPDGVYLTAIVDLEDPDEVMDLVIDRLLDFQINKGLAIQVVPVRTSMRVEAEVLRRASHQFLPAALTPPHLSH